MKPSRHESLSPVWLTAALGAMLALGSCQNRQPQARPQVSNVVLATSEPASAAGPEVRTYTGVVRARHEVNVGFKTAGQLQRLCAAEGQYVRRGQLLATLDDADYRLGVEALQAQYDQLQREEERMEQLFRQKSCSANDYEKTAAGLRQLGAQLQTSRNKLRYTRLYAPADGYVLAVNFAPAEMVDAGTAVFLLADVSRMEVEAYIPAADYRQRARIQSFACRLPGAEADCPMTLLSLAPKADASQLYSLRLTFSGRHTGGLPTAGENVEVRLTLRPRRADAAGGVTVPAEAVFRAADTTCVWVFRAADSTVVRRAVRVSGVPQRSGRLTVAAGLRAGERVVRLGVSALRTGCKVRVMPAPAATNVGGLL